MTTTGNHGRRLLSVKEAAAQSGLSPNTFYSWSAQGIHLPFVKLGRRVFIDAVDLDAFIQACKQQPHESIAGVKV